MPKVGRNASVLLFAIGIISLVIVLAIAADMEAWKMTSERQWQDYVITMACFTVLLFLIWEGAAHLARISRLVLPVLVAGSIALEVAVLLSDDLLIYTYFPYGFPYIGGPAILMILMVMAIFSVLLLMTLVIEVSIALAFDNSIPRWVFGVVALVSFLILLLISLLGPTDLSIASPIPIMFLWQYVFSDGSSLGALSSSRKPRPVPVVLSMIATGLIPFFIWIVHQIMVW